MTRLSRLGASRRRESPKLAGAAAPDRSRGQRRSAATGAVRRPRAVAGLEGDRPAGPGHGGAGAVVGGRGRRPAGGRRPGGLPAARVLPAALPQVCRRPARPARLGRELRPRRAGPEACKARTSVKTSFAEVL